MAPTICISCSIQIIGIPSLCLMLTMKCAKSSRSSRVRPADGSSIRRHFGSAAMARVRTSWQLERGDPVSVEFDPVDVAFEHAVRPAPPATVRRRKAPPAPYAASLPESPSVNPLTPPSLAAPPPEELAADYAPLSTEVLFPRAELLKFDGLTPFKKGTRR